MGLYEAENLDDIARHFDEMAGKASVAAGLTTGFEKKLRSREAVIWRQAAHTLRQTTMTKPLVGEVKTMGWNRVRVDRD